MRKVKLAMAFGLAVILLGIYCLALPTPEPTPAAEPKKVAEPRRVEEPKAEKPAKTIHQEETKKRELDPEEVELIGRTIWGEAGGVKSKAERAAVAWCILNRVDAYGKTIKEVVTAPNQFHGYRTAGECPQKHLDLAADVLARWYAETDGEANVGRVLPSEYLYFVGDGWRNHFSKKWRSTDYWDWSLSNPYID